MYGEKITFSKTKSFFHIIHRGFQLNDNVPNYIFNSLNNCKHL
jgi:hypothetical protein